MSSAIDYQNLLKAIEEQSFSKKLIDQWNRFYEYYGIHMCSKQYKKNPEMCAKNMLKTGYKYFGCMTLNSKGQVIKSNIKYFGDDFFHYCQICPIILGTELDLKIRNVDADEFYTKTFETYIINSGFFSTISHYITNNVKNVHKFISREHSTGRFFISNIENHSFMFYLYFPGCKLMMRTPPGKNIQVDITDEFGQFKLFSSLGITLHESDNLLNSVKLQDIKDYLMTVYSQKNDIDNINNKIILTGAYFYSLALELLIDDVAFQNKSNNKRASLTNHYVSSKKSKLDLPSTSSNNEKDEDDEEDNDEDEAYDVEKSKLQIAQFKKKIISGRLQFLISKKKLYFNKSDQLKYINKQIANINKIQQSSTILTNANETIKEEQANLIRRITSDKSKFLQCYYPTQSEGLVNMFFLSNLNSAGKSMNLVFHTRVTLLFNKEIQLLTNNILKILDQLPTCEDDGNIIVINLYIYPRKLNLSQCDCNVITQIKEMNDNISINKIDNYIIFKIQSGILQRLVLVNGPRGYCNNCKIFTHQRFKSDILKFSKCHVWLTNEEIANFATSMDNPKFFELMCGESIKILRYANITDISKSMCAVRTFRHHFTTLANADNLNLLSNKELSRGYILNQKEPFIKLFTLFYDYKGLNVEDGYLLSDKVNLPIMIATKHSIMLQSKSTIYLEKILKLKHYMNESEILIGKLYSTSPITQSSIKKILLEKISSSNSTYIYILKLIQINNIVSFIDKDSLELHTVNTKTSIIIHLLFKSKPNVLYPIKLSNSYAQKGMCSITDLSQLVRASGKPIDLTANPTSLITRSAVGQVQELLQNKEAVYDRTTGEFLGYGGYCDYFIPNIFPHDDIHGSTLTNAMRLDRLSFNNLVALNQQRAINILTTDHYCEHHWSQLEECMNLINMFGVEIKRYFNKHMLCNSIKQ